MFRILFGVHDVSDFERLISSPPRPCSLSFQSRCRSPPLSLALSLLLDEYVRRGYETNHFLKRKRAKFKNKKS